MDYIMMYLDRFGNVANIRRYLPKVLLNILLEKKIANSNNIHSGRNLENNSSKSEYLNQENQIQSKKCNSKSK
jgi:hypothetical protein